MPIRHQLIAVRENVRFAARALTTYKLRSALTVLGIVIGVTTVIAMVSIIEGFNNSVTHDFQAFGATLVQFQKFDPQFGPGSDDDSQRLRKNLTYEDAQALKALCPSMLAVSPERYWFNGNNSGAPDVIYQGKEATPDTIAGITQDYPIANNHFVSEGRFITEGDIRSNSPVIVLGSNIVDTLFPRSDPIGKDVTIAGRKFTVVGVMEKQGATFFESTDGHAFLPLTSFDAHFPWIKRDQGVNIATVPRKPEWVDRITEEGTAVLRARRKVPFNKPNDFGMLTPDKLIGNFKAVTGGITLAMLLISSIALLVGGVGVMNIMLVSVTERTREIGVRKAIGAVRRDIVMQFLTEAMTLSGVGGVIGVGAGMLIALIVRKVSPLTTATPLWSIVVGLVVSISIGLFFGIYPAYKAARLDPIDALRYE
ncbi:MAG: putative transport system permease protein [Thermoanaerobaculia bacterium]|jgi:putative ABC transport system permease protein|nr:putative transport system permease protein [Thermoanaerobaculia bacterium]